VLLVDLIVGVDVVGEVISLQEITDSFLASQEDFGALIIVAVLRHQELAAVSVALVAVSTEILPTDFVFFFVRLLCDVLQQEVALQRKLGLRRRPLALIAARTRRVPFLAAPPREVEIASALLLHPHEDVPALVSQPLLPLDFDLTVELSDEGVDLEELRDPHLNEVEQSNLSKGF